MNRRLMLSKTSSDGVPRPGNVPREPAPYALSSVLTLLRYDNQPGRYYCTTAILQDPRTVSCGLGVYRTWNSRPISVVTRASVHR